MRDLEEYSQLLYDGWLWFIKVLVVSVYSYSV